VSINGLVEAQSTVGKDSSDERVEELEVDELSVGCFFAFFPHCLLRLRL